MTIAIADDYAAIALRLAEIEKAKADGRARRVPVMETTPKPAPGPMRGRTPLLAGSAAEVNAILASIAGPIF